MSRFRARRDAIQTRALLWETGADFGMRESVCAFVRWHVTPFHYLDVYEEELFRQNSEREAEVPASVIRGLLDRWEVPDRTEAHRVDLIARG